MEFTGAYIEDSFNLKQSSSGDFGLRSELLAEEFLSASGYRTVVTNFKAPVGRSAGGKQVTGEIDIIALDGETLCFIEVKSRRSAEFASPLSAIDIAKQRQITRTARVYRQIFRIRDISWRYDAVTVVAGEGSEPEITIHKAFWDESVFKKRSWTSDIPYEDI